jgi:hypothetical protein
MSFRRADDASRYGIQKSASGGMVGLAGVGLDAEPWVGFWSARSQAQAVVTITNFIQTSGALGIVAPLPGVSVFTRRAVAGC